jgi:hypothetical protein
MLVVASIFVSPVLGAPDRSVEDRIRSAIEFIEGQYATNSTIRGFLHGNSTELIYARDNGLAALGLAAYHETHFSSEFYEDLKRAVSFLLDAQAAHGDVREFYDPVSERWGPGNDLYYWNSHVVMGVAYAAYAISEQVQSERGYWSTIVNKLRLCVDFWLPRKQLSNGAVTFSFPGGNARADVAANGAMLVGLVYLSLFEHFWGDRSLAIRYATWSQSIARWLWSLQERNQTSWGWGGLYTNNSRTLQLTYENAIAMFGLNKYYSAVGLLLAHYEPTFDQLRQSMTAWAEGFVDEISDSWGGPRYGRSADGVIDYPKQTLAASAVLQAMIDVWINMGGPTDTRFGPPFHWPNAMRIYRWTTGANELSVDLQSERDANRLGGGFAAGIEANRTIEGADTATTSLALYAFVRASFVRIPEFSRMPLMLSITFIFVAIAMVNRRINHRPASATINC